MKELITKCKASVTISVNEHRNCYETVREKFNSGPDADFREEIDEDVFNKMVETDTIIEIQFYPNTPVGFYRVYHYDIEKAIDQALSILNESAS